jgi:hypothetical protein
MVLEKEYFTNPRYDIPIEFEQVSNILDDRFMKVKVWIAHTGENRNNSIFSKEVLTSMIPSLSNIPILGYIAVKEDEEPDFLGHEERLVVEDGQFKLKYFGRAYGLIPTEHNARFETRFGEDGLEREYLVCDGLIWRKFPEVETIFDRDGGYKSQSMELQHSSVQGYTDNNGLFVFTQAKFEGACLLGESVSPAMVSSTIEKFSVADNIKNELSDMLTEFNAHFSATKEKGDDTVPTNEKILEPEANTEEAKVEAPAENPTEFKAETPVEEAPSPEETPVEEAPATDFAKKDDEDEEKNSDKKEDKEDEEDEEDEKPKKFTRTFELSHDDVRSGIYQALDQHESFTDKWFWISKVYDSHAIVENEDEGKFFKVNYVKHENAVSIGEFEELYPMFLSASEKQAIDGSRNNFEALEQEVATLREFKENIETIEKEQKLSQYSTTLSQEEYKSIKDNLKNFSVEDMEKEIGFMLLKKNKFSAKSEESTQTRVASTNAVESNPYGSASVYFTK